VRGEKGSREGALFHCNLIVGDLFIAVLLEARIRRMGSVPPAVCIDGEVGYADLVGLAAADQRQDLVAEVVHGLVDVTDRASAIEIIPRDQERLFGNRRDIEHQHAD